MWLWLPGVCGARGLSGKGQSLAGSLVEQDAAFDGLAADGALAHTVAAQLAGAVAAHENHVLQPVQTHGAHGLQHSPRENHSSLVKFNFNFKTKTTGDNY